MSTTEDETTEIGYVCGKGHFCFDADPDEGGQCGSKRVGTIRIHWDEDDDPDYMDGYHSRAAILDRCSESLARHLDPEAEVAAAERAGAVKALRDLAGDFPSVSQRVHVQALINARADEIDAEAPR